jgi:alpha,alpha-trehalase
MMARLSGRREMPIISNHKQCLLFSPLRYLLVALLLCTTPIHVIGGPQSGDKQGLKPIQNYISDAWDTLTRSMTNCESIVDPKIADSPVLYLPAGFEEPTALHELSGKCKVRVEHLPKKIEHLGEITSGNIDPPGLLYLPDKYVVPGGRFNEMYGWDSYFIIRGLLQAGRLELARGMVDNFFFEIENYGAMLNANRTYYLTRSQPPFVSSMFVDVYQAILQQGSAKDKKAN